MKHYVFAATDRTISAASGSLVAMGEACQEYFPIALENDDELKILMKLLGVEFLAETQLLSNADFSAIFDFSAAKLPQLGKEEFDYLYDEWLRLSGRQTNMDEYGQLIFLQERGDSWNAMANRFVLRET